MKKNILTCIITSLSIISISCNKETEVTSPQFMNASSANLNQAAAKHFIGEHFGGGIIFYIDQSGKHGLIAASADFYEPEVWSHKDTLTGAKDTALGSGEANTNKIYKAQGYPQYEADGYAALECLGLNINSYQDWYLPSLSELNEMYKNKTIIGGFQAFSYWSSSEGNSAKAWLKNFGSGTPFLQLKNAGNPIRPVRKF